MYSVICPNRLSTNHFGRECVYYDAYECFMCGEKEFFDDMCASILDLEDLSAGAVECVVGQMSVELEE